MSVAPSGKKRSGLTIRIKDLDLDRDGNGVVDSEELSLMQMLKEMDTDRDGEIGLAELCNLGNSLEAHKKKTRDMMRILWGVIGLSALTVVLVFVATFAANEVTKDSRPDKDGNIVTNGGMVASMQTYEKNVNITDLATMTSASLDHFKSLKFTLGDDTYMYTVTGYTINDVSPSQRSVKLYTARGDIVRVAVSGTLRSARVTHTDGTVTNIEGARTMRRMLLSDDSSEATATTDSADTEEVEVEATTECEVGSDTVAGTFEDPATGDYQLCNLASGYYCCDEASYNAFDVGECGASKYRCKISAEGGADLSSVLGDGIVAPAEGYVDIYTVDDEEGSITFVRTKAQADDPGLCNPKVFNYLCVYGMEATEEEVEEEEEEATTEITLGSMEDCQDFIARFSTTGSFDEDGTCSTSSTTYGFTNKGQTTTEFERFFCMECIEADTYHGTEGCTDLYEVVVHIYTSQLPDRWFSYPGSDIMNPKELWLPFKPVLNTDLESSLNVATDQESLDAILCDISWPSRSNYLGKTIGLDTNCNGNPNGKYSGFNTYVGFDLDGVPYLGAQSTENLDPYYPNVDGAYSADDIETVDGTLCHFQGSGMYHCHAAAPTIADSTLNVAEYAAKPCSNLNYCIDEPSVATSPDLTGLNGLMYYMMHGIGSGGYSNPTNSVYTSQTEAEGPIIGIAMDGRPIRGPTAYNSATGNWDIQPTGLDICNGKLTDSSEERSYSYYATTFHPYIVGCFGPGTGYSTTLDGVTASCSALTPDTYPTSVTFDLV